MTSKFNQTHALMVLALVLALSVTGCTSNPATVPVTEPAASASPTPTPSQTATPSRTPTPTQTRTPPSLPETYQSPSLHAGDSPHSYVDDTCQYLHDKWAPGKAEPGTVVMVIMFHSIGGETGGGRIPEAGFFALVPAPDDKGFAAVTTSQLADFMETNAAIPQRSVMLLVDDRRSGLYFEAFFRHYQVEWGWPVVNAWISLDDSIGRNALPDNVRLENEGWVDHQAHGVVHNIPMGPGASDEYILSELEGSIEAMQKNFDKTPLAIIWPGGNFSQRSVELARQTGYRLGFTVNPRGPLMYNWVPLADESDPGRPTWWPEGGMGDPLLVLPRTWSTDALVHIDETIQTGETAAAYAEANKATELDYYDIVCAGTYGRMP
jgi:hypothetical protein